MNSAGIAAIAIEKHQDFRILAHRCDAGLNRASVAALWFHNDAGAGAGCFRDGSVPRAAIHDDNFAHILSQAQRSRPVRWLLPRRGRE